MEGVILNNGLQLILESRSRGPILKYNLNIYAQKLRKPPKQSRKVDCVTNIRKRPQP